MRVWINGELLDDPRSPAVSVLDHGLTVGDGVFESVKIRDGEPFALTRHLARLQHSAAGLGLPAPDEQEVRRGVAAVTANQQWPCGRIRITVTAGPGPMGSGREGDSPTVAVVAQESAPSPASAAVAVVPWPRNERAATTGLKTTSYAENVIALARAREQGASEALFTTTTGLLCEGTGSNVFYVLGGELRTPSLATGCLAGVTRALLLEWVGAREVDEPVAVLQEAEEVFLASTTRDVQAVHRCDDRDLPVPGPVTREAARIWQEREQQSTDP